MSTNEATLVEEAAPRQEPMSLAHRDEPGTLAAPIDRPRITIEEMMMKALEIGQPELIDKFVAIYEKREAGSKKAAFDGAMARAQQRIQPVANNARNAHTGSNYAKLGAVNKAIAPIYGEEGLSIRFRPATAEQAGHVRIIAVVAHENGYEEEAALEWPIDDKGAEGKVNKTALHGMKSTTTYMQRTMVCLTFNVATEDDDDGNAGAGLDQPVNEKQLKELQKLFKLLSVDRQKKALDHFGLQIPEQEPLETALAKVDAREYNNKLKALATAIRSEGESATVSKEQEANLIALIDEIGGKCKQEFLTANKIRKVAELPAKQYQGALAALQQQRRK